MAQLAIFGHSTRGSEVIALLEMLGGKNIYKLTGIKETWYILSDGIIQHSTYLFEEKGFTLEQFEVKFPYKIGDKVIYEDKRREITKMVWEEQTNTVAYKLDDKLYCNVVNELQPYKEETIDRKYNVEEYLKVWKETEKGLEVVVNDNFELKEDGGKFYIIKKQSQYPKTYEECCKVLSLGEDSRLYTKGYKANLIQDFQKLLICYDAYRKIAGEQIGLGKPWEHDWNEQTPKYTIVVLANELVKRYALTQNFILAFPTEEIRDAFYENFKDLIEQCKELL